MDGHPRGRAVGRPRGSGVPGCGQGHLADPPFHHRGHAGGGAPGLERPGGAGPVVLQPQVVQARPDPEPVQAEQRSEALPQRHRPPRFLHRQQFPVAPHRGHPPGQVVGPDGRPYGLQVVLDQQRTAALAQVVDLQVVVTAPAPGALEVTDKRWHGGSPQPP